MSDTITLLGRGLTKRIAALLFTVPAGEIWTPTCMHIVNLTENLRLFSCFQTLDTDVTPGLAIQSLYFEQPYGAKQQVRDGGGMNFPALSRCFIQSDEDDGFNVTVFGIKSTNATLKFLGRLTLTKTIADLTTAVVPGGKIHAVSTMRIINISGEKQRFSIYYVRSGDAGADDADDKALVRDSLLRPKQLAHGGGGEFLEPGSKLTAKALSDNKTVIGLWGTEETI